MGSARTELAWGKRWKPGRCWSAENAELHPHPVGAHAPNGLLDVHGNVAELVTRDRGEGYQLRGGSFRKPGAACAFSNREDIAADEVRDDVGLRVVVDLHA